MCRLGFSKCCVLCRMVNVWLGVVFLCLMLFRFDCKGHWIDVWVNRFGIKFVFGVLAVSERLSPLLKVSYTIWYKFHPIAKCYVQSEFYKK